METVNPPPLRELPCDICGEPCVVKNPKAEWAAHWSCAILGLKRIKELKAQHDSASGNDNG